MYVRVVGVVMVDRDPFELRAEVALHLPDQSTHMLTEIEPVGILGRDDEAPQQFVLLLPPAHRRQQVDTSRSASKPKPLLNSCCAPGRAR
ncbi:MAG: hypothetical protein ACREQD_07695 [Candidatus Binataceae bacterium]